LSAVGFGTAQLQMVSERQAVETLQRGFALGVNWVHTAPDYGGVEPWIARAIAEARADVMVLSQSPAHVSLLPAFRPHLPDRSAARGWRYAASIASKTSSASARTCGAAAG
jgi:hypothetical protein